MKSRLVPYQNALKLWLSTKPMTYKIKPAILKNLREFRAPIFTTLFNKAIAENQYPNSLKLTKVIELFKKEDRSNPSKYRPISLLPIIAKVLDKIINTQVMTHMLKHKILSATQYAYRPKSSTSMALQTVINRIHTNATKRLPVLAIYLDKLKLCCSLCSSLS